MQLITLDFETYYDSDYSLSKLTTEEYVRDDRFEVIGVGIAYDSEPAVWYPQPDVAAALAAVPWDDAMVLCHNTLFDGAIVSWRYGYTPKAWADTLSMSRALYPQEASHSLAKAAGREPGLPPKGTEVHDAKGMRYKDFAPIQLINYGRYCTNDVEITRTLFKRYVAAGFPMTELRLIDLTIRMFTEPVFDLDAAQLRAHLDRVNAAKDQRLDAARDALLQLGHAEFTQVLFSGEPDALTKVLRSDGQLAEALRLLGVPPPMKISPRTGKEAYAFARTDEEFTALQDCGDPAVEAVVAARLGVKTSIEESRTTRFLGIASRGKLPIPLRYYGAHSGRWSGTDNVNLQNLPSRGPNSGALKRAIMAPPGHVVLDGDSSQIEARTLAWLAGQDDLVAAFAARQDVYRLTATYIYGGAIDDVTQHQRQVGKGVVLGCGYGVGAYKLQAYLWAVAQVRVTLEEAQQLVDVYRATYRMIPMLWRRAEQGIHSIYNGTAWWMDTRRLLLAEPRGIRLPNGLHLQYPGLQRDFQTREWSYRSRTGQQKIYGGKVVENYTQAIARAIIGEQMLRIAKRYRPVLTVHDSIVLVVPEREADEAKAFMAHEMSTAPKWAPGLPVACEIKVGASYGG